jgi:putative transposase
MKATRKHYSAEFKARVVQEMLREEHSISELISTYGIPKTVLYRWREQALKGLPTLFSDQAAHDQQQREQAWQQEREELYAEIGRLTTQLTWLKKKSGQLFDPHRAPGTH